MLDNFEDNYNNYNEKLLKFNAIKKDPSFKEIDLNLLDQVKFDGSIKLIKNLDNLELEKDKTIELLENNQIEKIVDNYENYLNFEEIIKQKIKNYLVEYKLEYNSVDNDDFNYTIFTRSF